MAPYRGHFWWKTTPKLILSLVALAFGFILLVSIYTGTNDSRILEMKRRNIYNSDYENHTNKPDDDEQILFDGHRFIEQPDLLYRLNDLKKIKLSLNNELRIIAKERSKILKEVTNLQGKSEKINLQISMSKTELKQLEIDLSANKKRKLIEACDNSKLTPVVFNPLESHDIEQLSLGGSSNSPRYDMEHDNQDIPGEVIYKFDLSKCPLTTEFKFNLFILAPSSTRFDQFANQLQSHHSYQKEVFGSCITFYMVQNTDNITSLDTILDARKNNVIILTTPMKRSSASIDGLRKKAAFVSYDFSETNTFRREIDIVIPSILKPVDEYNSIIGSRLSMIPIAKKYTASYFGRVDISNKNHKIARLESVLQTIHRNSFEDLFLFLYDCGPESGQRCYEQKDKLIELCNFLIIFPPESGGYMDKYTNDMIYLSLSKGTIPVIIGKNEVRLPFDEVLDWRLASIILPIERLPELHFILSTYSASDIYQLKYHGKRIFDTHMATTQQIVDTMIALISVERFQIGPKPVESVKSTFYDAIYDASVLDWTKLKVNNPDETNSSSITEMLGPHEIPLKSANYLRNMSLVLNSGHELWNNVMNSALKLYPSLPNDPIVPSEYKFLSADPSYRTIGNGAGGSGVEFSRSLGGDMPNEQFTVILLTYERLENLIKTLDRLKGMPYVNKYLVIWNSITRPPSIAAAQQNLSWPPKNLGAPLKVLKVDRNSLNNRFLPFDEIETDAILSLDDDSPLRQDELVFAFRVWRESRDRLVGFPGRFHGWDLEHQSWIYNSNHSCELSMVLTGGAFFHRYYLYAYTYEMPSIIRQIVDNLMNCEDIAMNFLIAHLTRKTPIKVTSRWTFTCQDCPNSLSDDPTHFNERHECLNIFASIYGYMPLLSTQHRSDSVLFKTRLPIDKQKCFKFV